MLTRDYRNYFNRKLTW